MTFKPTPRAALDTSTLSLAPSQAPVTRTILGCDCANKNTAASEWYSYEIVYWSLDGTRDKKERPEFRVFETFAGSAPEGLTNDELHFSAKCAGSRVEVLASKVVRDGSAGDGEVDNGQGKCGSGKIAFIAGIPVKPECLEQAKAFLTGPYAACIQAETCTQYWYAFQRSDDATTLGLFGMWTGEEELKEHMEGGAVDFLDKGLEPFMSGPFDRRKGSVIAYRT